LLVEFVFESGPEPLFFGLLAAVFVLQKGEARF
jgi:hypothetical protein